MTHASACGKVVLFGEHAVVYGRPAVAVPLSQTRAHVEVQTAPACAGLRVVAVDLGRELPVTQETAGDPLAMIVLLTLLKLEVAQCNLTITVRSDVPAARGLGSGAAVSTAIARALAAHVGRAFSRQTLADLVFETEKVYHGSPSGMDNTVIAFERPIYFIKGQPATPLTPGAPITLIVADTGIVSSTREAVAGVRRAWEQARGRYEELFDACGHIATAGRVALEAGDRPRLGALMDENQAVLEQMGVSSPELERLIAAARAAGAWGAKLCGAGRGGNMIALVAPATAAPVAEAIRRAGAVSIMTTTIGAPSEEKAL